jgi:hypothetical protein
MGPRANRMAGTWGFATIEVGCTVARSAVRATTRGVADASARRRHQTRRMPTDSRSHRLPQASSLVVTMSMQSEAGGHWISGARGRRGHVVVSPQVPVTRLARGPFPTGPQRRTVAGREGSSNEVG